MLLTPGLAQQVIDALLPLVRQNVNLMDASGTIIASCQPRRLGSFHQGARDALAQQVTVEITPETMALFPGSLPGVNMPILLAGQAIGVVGISGHPDEVRDTAKLVKAVTELLLERELLREKFHSQAQLQEHFASLLLSPRAAQELPALRTSAKLLKYDLSLPRQVAVADTQPLLQPSPRHGPPDLVAARLREGLLQQALPLLGPRDFAVFLEQRLVILREAPQGEAAALPALLAWGEALRRQLSAAAPPRLGLGGFEAAPERLGHSYQESLFALGQSSAAQPVAAIGEPSVLAAYALRYAPGADCRPLGQLREALRGGGLRKFDMEQTLAVLLQHNLNTSLTAKGLFIHRNTLLFRLQKLREATGLDPCHHFDHAVLCRLLLELS